MIGRDICHCTSCGKFCLSLPGKKMFATYSQFKIRLCSTWILFLSMFSKEFDPGTQGAFSRDWNCHRTPSLACSHKSHVRYCVRSSANLIWKVNLLPVPDRLFISSPCHNFGCDCSLKCLVDSHILHSAKPWYFSGSSQFEQYRRRRARSAQRSLCLSIRKSRGLHTKREVGKRPSL